MGTINGSLGTQWAIYSRGALLPCPDRYLSYRGWGRFRGLQGVVQAYMSSLPRAAEDDAAEGELTVVTDGGKKTKKKCSVQ